MWKPDWKKHGPTGLLALFSVGMVAPMIFAGKIILFRDFGRFYYPIKRLYIDRLLEGSFPLWSKEVCCGTPLHGEMVHAFLYPPNLLLFLGAAPGWGLYFAAHLLLAGWGARRLALRLGAADIPALAAGFAFAGSGYLISQMNHVPYASTAAWAPLIVSLVLDLSNRRPTTVPLLAICFAMAALAGEPFTLLLTIAFAGFLILAGFAGRRVPAILWTGVAGAIGVLIASPSLIPAYQQLGESVRAGGVDPDMEGFGSLHPVRFLTIFAPEGLGRLQHAIEMPVPFFRTKIDIVPPILLGIHLGALTLVAVLVAPIRSSRAVRWLLPVIIVAGLLSLGPHLGLATWLSKNVPGLRSFRYPDKYWFVVTLAAAPLLGLAIERLKPAPTVAVAVIGATLAFALGLAARHPGGAVTGALAFALVAAAFRLPQAWRIRGLTAVLALELLFFGYRHNLLTEPANMTPMHPDGIGRILKREQPVRFFVDYSLPSDYLEQHVDEATRFQLQGLEAMGGVPDGFSYSIGYDPIEPIGRISKFFKMPGRHTPNQRTMKWHRLLRLAATTHAVTNRNLGGDPEVVPLIRWPGDVKALLYVRPAARARLYGDSVWVPDQDAGRDRVQDLTFDPFRVLVLEGEGEPETNGPPKGKVEFIEDEPNRVRLSVRSDRPAWLFLADSYSRGWNARLNGKPTDLRIGHVAFRAVRVPEGASEVEFRYEPEWLGIAPITAGAGLLLLALSFWWGRRFRRGTGPISASGPGNSRTSSADGK